MPLTSGTQLGPYQIVAPLGAGGMGEVYRAHDTRLDRDVAIKVLPDAFVRDPERLARFEQEARSTGQLNHPNILAVYDVGRDGDKPYVVSELLEGETLRMRLQNGALPVRKAIELAIQAANGLAAAHDQGVVHRDLKPENLFITHDGRMKILDFGLAKLTERVGSAADETEAATVAVKTEKGVVLGTAGYMSPEQVRGREVDHRSDLFSLGAILYEMVSGERAFRGDSPADTMSAILKEDPPELSSVSTRVPPGLDLVVRHCLEKQPGERFQSARDLAFHLEAVSAGSGASAPVAAPTRTFRLPLLAVAAVALLVVGALIGHALWTSPPPQPPTFTQVTYDRGMVTSARFATDGQTIVYGARWNGKPPQLFLKRPESPDAIALDLPAAQIESISPSGELAILLDNPSQADQTLARVALTGGAPRAIAEHVVSADWNRQGSDLIVDRSEHQKTTIEYPKGHVLYETTSRVEDVRLSPRGDVIALVIHPLANDTRGRIALLDFDGRLRTLTPEWSAIDGLAWSPSAEEIWFTGSATSSQLGLHAVSRASALRTLSLIPSGMKIFDVSSEGRVLLASTPTRIELKCEPPGSDIEHELSWLDFSVAITLSRDGRTLLFAEASDAVGEHYAVCVRGTDGSPVVRLGDGIPLDLSPDGKWVLSRLPQSDAALTMLPTGAGESRVVAGQGLTLTGGQWLPDGRRMLISGRDEGGELRMYVQDVNGSNRRPITPAGVGHRAGWRPPFPVSSDSHWVAAPDATGEFKLYPIEGGTPIEIPGLGRDESAICWSANGRWIYVAARGKLPYDVDRIDWRSGRRERWKSITPSDSAGVTGLFTFTMTPDARSYAYCFIRTLSELYVVEGLE